VFALSDAFRERVVGRAHLRIMQEFAGLEERRDTAKRSVEKQSRPRVQPFGLSAVLLPRAQLRPRPHLSEDSSSDIKTVFER
jgi:hypothetical protein